MTLIDLDDFIVEPFSQQLAEQYLQCYVFAFDTEDDTYDYHQSIGFDGRVRNAKRGLSYPADMTHISLYADGLPAMVLTAQYEQEDYVYDFFNIDTEEFELRQGQRWHWYFSDDEQRFIKAMFGRDGYTAIAHNLVFDARQIFGKFNIAIPQSNFWDTRAVAVFGGWGENFDDHDDDPDRDSYGLDDLTLHWLTEKDQQWWKGFKSKRGDLSRLLTDAKYSSKSKHSENDVNRYVAVDSLMAYFLYQWQRNEIDNNGYEANSIVPNTDSMATLLNIDLDYTRLCVEMAVKGIRVNTDYLKEELIKYVRIWKQSLPNLGLTVETCEDFRKPKWKIDYILSRITPPEDADIIYRKKLKTKTGTWSANKDAIKYYSESFPELFLFRYHADLETKITDIVSFLNHSEYDGRIHSTLSRFTITGRNSATSPNMQNLRMKEKDGYPKSLKEQFDIEKPGLDCGYFIADDGYALISLDCSNAENWMGAMYGRDDDMALACAQADFHTAMAKIYFADIWDSLTPEQRKAYRNTGKIITFGTSYGMGVDKLARDLVISKEEAQQFLRNKDIKFWRIKKAKDSSSEYGKNNGFTILWTGRRVKLAKWKGQYKGYTAWNSLAQGGVGEMIVRGMLRSKAILDTFGDPKQYVVMQIHDELVIQIDPAKYTLLLQPIIEALSTVIPDEWNNRTTPACRWLFTLDNIENSHKWGYDPYKEYTLPIDEYVNRWGHHQYVEADKGEAPTWINQWGYGEAALNKELGIANDDEDIVITVDSFDWNEVETVIRQCVAMLNNTVQINGRTFVFPQSIHVARALYHKGVDTKPYLQYLETFDKLVETMEKYKEWKQ